VPGITRIEITNPLLGRGAYRFSQSAAYHLYANRLYRRIFEVLNMPLAEGDENLKCTKDEFIAGFDYALGIDVIFRLQSGKELTLQEKFLFTKWNTVTVEYMQNPLTGEQGDWFKMKTQLYFVGYAYEDKRRFNNWVLLDWTRVQMATEQGLINWEERQNKNDGAKATFRYSPMFDFPIDCVVYSSRLAVAK
jgi:hypothetical protein